MVLPDLLSNLDNLLLLLFIGLGAGILSGFSGVGGAFIVTPALIIIGFPAHFAVGTGLMWVVGKSVTAAWSHNRLGNVDVKLGLVVLVASTIGMEGGVRVLNWAKGQGMAEEVVLTISLVMLVAVGSYTLVESYNRKKELDEMRKRGESLPAEHSTGISRRLQRIRLSPVISFPRSGVKISFWILFAIGLFVGTLAGLMGVGGGFIMVPSLVYLVGMPSFMAVGTDLFQIVFSAAYGTIRHTLSGNVYVFAAFLMVITSAIGVQFGVLVTRFVRGISVRYVLGISIILSAVGVALKLTGILNTAGKALFENISLFVTLGSLLVTVLMIIALYITALRHRRGMRVPAWMESFIADEHVEEKRPGGH